MAARLPISDSWIPPLLSLAAFAFAWEVLARSLHSPALPGLGAIADSLWREAISGRLPQQLGATLRRLALGFCVAMTAGTAIGIWLGRHRAADRFFDGWLVLALNTPALVTIILCYVWFGLNEMAALIAVVVNKLPNVVVTIREGTRSLDRDLEDMARAYRFGRMKTVRHVILPQLAPYLLGAARNGLALVWKIILVVELLGLSNGVGYQLHLFFQMFDVAGILAYTAAFVAVIQVVEWVCLRPLDRWTKRWRR